MKQALYAAALAFLAGGVSAETPAEPTVWPVSGKSDQPTLPLIAPWGPRGRGGYEFHRGVDFPGKIGTPIHAVRAGTVIRMDQWENKNLRAGKFIVLDHAPKPDGTPVQTAYLHLNRIAVQMGQKVRCGEVIGELGITGRGNPIEHLHFEYHDGLWGPQTNSRDPLFLFNYPKRNDYKISLRRGKDGVEVFCRAPGEEPDLNVVTLTPEKGKPLVMDLKEHGGVREPKPEYDKVRVTPRDYEGKLWTFICTFLGAPAGVRYRVEVANCKGDKLASDWVDVSSDETDAPLKESAKDYDAVQKVLETAAAAAEKDRIGEALKTYDRILKARGPTQLKARAADALAALHRRAEERMTEAERLGGEGKPEEGIQILKKITQDFHGTPTATEADRRMKALTAKGRQ